MSRLGKIYTPSVPCRRRRKKICITFALGAPKPATSPQTSNQKKTLMMLIFIPPNAPEGLINLIRSVSAHFNHQVGTFGMPSLPFPTLQKPLSDEVRLQLQKATPVLHGSTLLPQPMLGPPSFFVFFWEPSLA